MNYILNLDIEDFLELYIETLIKKQEDKLFQEWLVQVPYMDKDSYISFNDYLNNCKQNNQSSYNPISDEELLKEMEEVMKQFER